MSRFDRAAGIARSLAIYHGIPLRQRRLRRLYRHFVERGDLAFDIGAHAGNRARALTALGCRVVAVEPQPDFAKLLHALFARGADLEVVNAAVGQAAGRTQLSISERTPTVTTVADAWREARADEPDFERVRWTRTIDVEMTTLDLLIARFGVPRFVKIDVEGSELAVLSGLTRPVAGLSFEYLPRALDQVRACVHRLATLGDYRFNYSPGESYELAEDDWITGRELVEALGVPDRLRGSGDVYARLREA